MKDFNLQKYLKDNPLTQKKQVLKKGKINEAFEGFNGVRSIAPIHEAPIQTRNSNFDPTDMANYDEESRPNKWIADIDRLQPEYGDWKASYEYPGIIVWSHADIPDAMVVATPGWDGKGTPVEFQSVKGSHQMLKVLDQDDFPNIKAYITAIAPYLDMVEDANLNPTSTDYEKSPIKAPGMGEFQGLHEGLPRMKTLFVLDYGSGTVYEKAIPANMQSEEIEEMLADEYSMNPADVYYMITDKNQVENLDDATFDEGYMGTQYDSSEDMAVDMVKKGIREDDYKSMTADKGWEYDDDEMEEPSRISGLVDQRELAKFGEAVMAIAQDLDNEGFDSIDIKTFLKDRLDDMIIA